MILKHITMHTIKIMPSNFQFKYNKDKLKISNPIVLVINIQLPRSIGDKLSLMLQYKTKQTREASQDTPKPSPSKGMVKIIAIDNKVLRFLKIT